MRFIRLLRCQFRGHDFPRSREARVARTEHCRHCSCLWHECTYRGPTYGD